MEAIKLSGSHQPRAKWSYRRCRVHSFIQCWRKASRSTSSGHDLAGCGYHGDHGVCCRSGRQSDGYMYTSSLNARDEHAKIGCVNKQRLLPPSPINNLPRCQSRSDRHAISQSFNSGWVAHLFYFILFVVSSVLYITFIYIKEERRGYRSALVNKSLINDTFLFSRATSERTFRGSDLPLNRWACSVTPVYLL